MIQITNNNEYNVMHAYLAITAVDIFWCLESSRSAWRCQTDAAAPTRLPADVIAHSSNLFSTPAFQIKVHPALEQRDDEEEEGRFSCKNKSQQIWRQNTKSSAQI